MAVNQNDILEVSCVQDFGLDNEVVNVFHVRPTSVGSFTDSDADIDVGDAFADLYNLLESELSSGMVAREIRWRNVTDAGPTRFVPWGVAYTGGSAAGDALPPGTALLDLLRTGVLNVQGKKYFGVFAETRQEAGTWQVNAMTAMLDVNAMLVAGFTGSQTAAEYEFLVYSRTLEQGYPIISASARPNVAYQRRRRFGHGS